MIFIDGKETVEVSVPDTGWWEIKDKSQVEKKHIGCKIRFGSPFQYAYIKDVNQFGGNTEIVLSDGRIITTLTNEQLREMRWKKLQELGVSGISVDLGSISERDFQELLNMAGEM